MASPAADGAALSGCKCSYRMLPGVDHSMAQDPCVGHARRGETVNKYVPCLLLLLTRPTSRNGWLQDLSHAWMQLLVTEIVVM